MNAESKPTSRSKRFWLSLADIGLCVCICLIYAGTPAPDVNESHYLTKAKHFWDPAFAKGDLFLESADAHWFFFSTLGWFNSVLDLPLAAWVGRGLVWLLIAWGWQRFVSAFSYQPFAATLSFLPLLYAIDFGHLSGEWMVGGFESKGAAYGLILAGFGRVVRGNWNTAWLLMGLASAFHVVVGAWVTLSLLLTFALIEAGWNPLAVSWRKQWLWLFGGGVFSLPGLVPALLLNTHASKAETSQAAQIYVYDRLPHHLSPLHFSTERWQSHCLWLVVVAILFCIFAFRFPKPVEQPTSTCDSTSVPRKLRFAWTLAALAGLFAIGGCFIDWLGTKNHAWSASLLRYYWFRWNDVAWPIAVSLTLMVNAFAIPSLPSWRKWGAVVLLVFPGSFWLFEIFRIQWVQEVPEADCRSLLMQSESPEQELRTYEDWLAACEWIREMTPEGELWITPRYQQTFLWYARRAEVVNWKNVPQDASQIVAWSERMKDVYRYTREGGLIPNNTEALLRLGKKYKARYALIDRRIYFRLPDLHCIYPTSLDPNATYAIYRLPDVAEDASSNKDAHSQTTHSQTTHSQATPSQATPSQTE